MNPELVIVLAFLNAKREKKGKRWCRAVTGAMRGEVASPLAVEPATPGPHFTAYAEARIEAADILRRRCVACGRCELARE